VAEWTLQGDGNRDFYDGKFSSRLRASLKLQLVSLVDGYNLPMRIDNNVGCPVAACPVDLGPNCLSILPFLPHEILLIGVHDRPDSPQRAF
jgi:hypothetical protein